MMGFEPTTFCMASGSWVSRVAESAWLSRILCVGRRVEAPRDSWRFPPVSGDLGIGWLLVPIRADVVSASAMVAAAQRESPALPGSSCAEGPPTGGPSATLRCPVLLCRAAVDLDFRHVHERAPAEVAWIGCIGPAAECDAVVAAVRRVRA